MASERKRRPAPTRTAPKRGTVSGDAPAPDNGNGTNPYSFARAVDQSLKTAQRVAEAIDLTTRDAVERGVETAYNVVDEYVRRGRAAAARRHTHAPGANDMNQERKGP